MATERHATDELTHIFIVPRFASTVDGLKDAGLDPREMDIISASRPVMTLILERLKSDIYKTLLVDCLSTAYIPSSMNWFWNGLEQWASACRTKNIHMIIIGSPSRVWSKMSSLKAKEILEHSQTHTVSPDEVLITLSNMPLEAADLQMENPPLLTKYSSTAAKYTRTRQIMSKFWRFLVSSNNGRECTEVPFSPSIALPLQQTEPCVGRGQRQQEVDCTQGSRAINRPRSSPTHS